MVNRPLVVILTTVTLDAVGYGLVLPVLPSLLRELTHESEIAGRYGVYMAIYPLMQLVCSPILGRLSDRFGRRPLLLVSLAGAAVDYLVMGLSASLSVLYLGRVLAGVTGANVAVATAALADISSEDDRARRFGSMHACFGLGFIAGPILGGLVGSFSPRWPFLLAAAFNAMNLVMGYFALPETRRLGDVIPPREPRRLLGSLGRLLGVRAILPPLAAYTLLYLIGQIPGSIWVVYGEDRFGWDLRMVGLSYAAYGLLHALAQAFLTAPTTRVLGERGTILLGVVADASAFVAMVLVTEGWMVFPVLVLFAMGGISMPALQALLSRQVDEDHQGELQGTLVSLASLAEVIGPIATTSIYAASPTSGRGAVWLIGVGLYLAFFPALLRKMTPATSPADQAA